MPVPRCKSPKSCASPVDVIFTYSIEFSADGLRPPAITPLVFVEPEAGLALIVDKDPKSIAFPSDAIVI